ncbi:UNVERIFIED_ORG: hypothetical protein J2Y84_001957 [Pseudomonas reinekei]|nr:hypothetical protein [Pseudomonas reinekei]
MDMLGGMLFSLDVDASGPLYFTDAYIESNS